MTRNWSGIVAAVVRKEWRRLMAQPKLIVITLAITIALGVVSPLRRLMQAPDPRLFFLRETTHFFPVLPLALGWGFSAISLWGARSRGETVSLRMAPVPLTWIWAGEVVAVWVPVWLLSVCAWFCYLLGARLWGVSLAWESATLAATGISLFVATPVILAGFLGWAVLLFLVSPNARLVNILTFVLVFGLLWTGLPWAPLYVNLLVGGAVLISATLTSRAFNLQEHLRDSL